MRANTILNALENGALHQPSADLAAKAGFLEWVLGLPDGANARAEALKALGTLHDRHTSSKAAQIFIGFLQEATAPVQPIRRGGAAGRRRVLH